MTYGPVTYVQVHSGMDTQERTCAHLEKWEVNLWAAGMKAHLRHNQGIISGKHHASEQLGLPFHTAEARPEGSQGTVHDGGVQDTFKG
jgi:hypothetical protein